MVTVMDEIVTPACVLAERGTCDEVYSWTLLNPTRAEFEEEVPAHNRVYLQTAARTTCMDAREVLQWLRGAEGRNVITLPSGDCFISPAQRRMLTRVAARTASRSTAARPTVGRVRQPKRRQPEQEPEEESALAPWGALQQAVARNRVDSIEQLLAPGSASLRSIVRDVPLERRQQAYDTWAQYVSPELLTRLRASAVLLDAPTLAQLDAVIARLHTGDLRAAVQRVNGAALQRLLPLLYRYAVTQADADLLAQLLSDYGALMPADHALYETALVYGDDEVLHVLMQGMLAPTATPAPAGTFTFLPVPTAAPAPAGTFTPVPPPAPALARTAVTRAALVAQLRIDVQQTAENAFVQHAIDANATGTLEPEDWRALLVDARESTRSAERILQRARVNDARDIIPRAERQLERARAIQQVLEQMNANF